MTDGTAADEPANDDESAANGSDAIRYRGADGEWRELDDVEPKRTGDPELDAIWAMSFRELEAILGDASHPLHEKARRVSAEITKPLADVIRPLTDSLSPRFDFPANYPKFDFSAMLPKFNLSALYPNLDTSSWIARLMPDMPKIELPDGILKGIAANAISDPPAPVAIPESRQIDFDAVEPPDVSLAEIEEAAEDVAHEMRSKQLEALGQMVVAMRDSATSGEEALKISKQTLNETKSTRKAGWWAAGAAMAAAVLAAAGIIVSIALSGGG